ncbi:MAG: signal peptidase I, partial [Candidatus Aenigmarchaeota archaeon]|nr:signal peptidase I [Candidatus Aenigmarchaeota archaeon]NIT03961.1 signal peptidase I [Candidatus Saccharibacteria bacterium]
FLDIIETVVLALAIFVLVYLFLVQPHQVRGNSMYPNFHDGEYLLTDKISYRLGEPDRGDVIVFKAPKNQEYDYIKRIVALPGDSVVIRNGKIYLNNQLAEETYLPEEFSTS